MILCRPAAVEFNMRYPRLDTALELAALADERVTVEFLAECTGLSGSRFSHLFSRATGMLPLEYLTLIKRYHRERQLAVQIVGEALGHKPLVN